MVKRLTGGPDGSFPEDPLDILFTQMPGFLRFIYGPFNLS